MIVHILRMYNSKNPHTWDESLPYVQNSYNQAFHSSIGHNLFQLGLGFQPLGPIIITEISSANGCKNSTSSNSYEVTHGLKLQQNNFQRVKNYTISDKIKGHYEYTGRMWTCEKHKHKIRTHAHDARLLSQKAAHLRNNTFMRVVSLPPTSGSASKLI
jgi:hypothetical protein